MRQQTDDTTYLTSVIKFPDLKYGAPGRIRTCGTQIRNLALYPTELRAQKKMVEKKRVYFYLKAS